MLGQYVKPSPSVALMFVALALTASCGSNSNRPSNTEQSINKPSSGNLGPTAEIKLDAPPILPFEYTLPNDSHAIALTFDDGPDDYGNTAKIVDILVENRVPATFFVNADAWSDIVKDSAATQAIKAIAAHKDLLTFGNHTDHHLHLPTLPATQIDNELNLVQDKVRQITGQADLRITQFRAPYGEPYQHSASPDPKVTCVAAHYAAHIGWSVDSDDWSCGAWFPTESVQGTPEQMATSTKCVIDNFNKAMAAAPKGGIVLMHSPYPYTVEALKTLLRAVPEAGYHFVPVEDFVKSKFGGTSDEITPYDGCRDSVLK